MTDRAAILVCLAACAAVFLLDGCAVGPDYATPETRLDQPAFMGVEAKIATAEPLPEEWWRGLNDPQLNDLIAQALRANHDLRIATANVEAARAILRSVSAQSLPSVTANAAYSRARPSAAETLNEPNIAEPDFDLTSAAAQLQWELDLFGRVRRTVEAAEADAEESEATRRGVMIMVIADTASAYIDLRGAQARLTVAIRNETNQRGTYELTQTLSEAGRGTDLDIARARAQLETTSATIPPLWGQITTDLNRLCVLTGQQPGALKPLLFKPGEMPRLPQFVSIGDPNLLLRRRPDVAAAERHLAGTVARVGVATADLYPTITLTGNVGVAATGTGDLGKLGAFTYGVGPSLILPLFDRGALYARLRAADATSSAAVASFEKTILISLEEVETALTVYGEEQKRHVSLEAAAEASARAAELAALRYRYGAENFISVLDAERTRLTAEDELAQSDILLAQDLILIYRALGGGWTG